MRETHRMESPKDLFRAPPSLREDAFPTPIGVGAGPKQKSENKIATTYFTRNSRRVILLMEKSAPAPPATAAGTATNFPPIQTPDGRQERCMQRSESDRDRAHRPGFSVGRRAPEVRGRSARAANTPRRRVAWGGGGNALKTV